MVFAVPIAMMSKTIFGVAILAFTLVPLVRAQNENSASAKQKSNAVNREIDRSLPLPEHGRYGEGCRVRPLTQHDRTQIYLKTMANPLVYLKAGFSAGIDQWNDKPSEWEQGASGCGKRFANIVGQYSIQRPVTFSLGSVCARGQPLFQFWQEGTLVPHWICG